MSESMIVCCFLLIVFTPCLLAYMAWVVGDVDSSDETYSDQGHGLARMGRLPGPLQAALPELPIGGDFEIRNFPKGLSQRRILVRDAEDGPRLTIMQVREAALELAKLGGFVVAHELALVAAALVAAGKSVAAAAREAMEAAHRAFTRREWEESGRSMNLERVSDEGPPRFAFTLTHPLYEDEAAVA